MEIKKRRRPAERQNLRRGTSPNYAAVVRARRRQRRQSIYRAAMPGRSRDTRGEARSRMGRSVSVAAPDVGPGAGMHPCDLLLTGKLNNRDSRA